MNKFIHVIIVNEEINKYGRRVHIPYCHCSWKGGEFVEQYLAYRSGIENHIDKILASLQSGLKRLK